MHRSRPIISLIAWTVGLVGLLVTLIRLDSSTGGSPPMSSPTAAVEWLEHLEPALVGFTIVRLAAVVAVGYLMLVTAVALSARLTDRAALVRAADRVTVPAVRQLVGRSVGLGITASVIVSTGPALAGPTTAHEQPVDDEHPLDDHHIDERSDESSNEPTDEPVLMVLLDDNPVPDEPRQSPAASTATQRLLDPVEGDDDERPAPDIQTGDEPPATVSDSVASTSTPEAGASSTSAPATVPPSDLPVGPSAPTEEPPAVSETWTIQPGEHLWAVAAETLADRGDARPTNGEIAAYLDVLIAANRHRLADPNNPDLVYPGQMMELPR